MPITIRYWDHHRAGYVKLRTLWKTHVYVQRAIELSWYSYDDSFCTKTASKKCDLYRKAAAVVDTVALAVGASSQTHQAQTRSFDSVTLTRHRLAHHKTIREEPRHLSEISRMHNQADQADYAADRWSGMIRRQVVMIRPAPKLIRQRWPLIRPGPAVQYLKWINHYPNRITALASLQATKAQLTIGTNPNRTKDLRAVTEQSTNNTETTALQAHIYI